MAVRAPARADATAWLKPLPPKNISNPVPMTVSPRPRAPRRADGQVHHETADDAHRTRVMVRPGGVPGRRPNAPPG